jgi:tetratricopeptide (TPR) repeat protein
MSAKSYKRPRLQSILSPSLKKLLVAALGLAVFMSANTAYLLLNRLADTIGFEYFAVGETSLPKLFQAMVLTHTGAGLLLTLLMLVFMALHLPKVWQRKQVASIGSGIAYVAVGLTLTITGLFILTAAASRNNSWAWWAHVICAGLAVGGYVAHRVVSYTRPPATHYRKFAIGVGLVLLVLIIAHGFTKRDIVLTGEAQLAMAEGLSDGPGGKYRDISQFVLPNNKKYGFVPTGFVPPASPFFPSAATTSSGSYLPARIITRGEKVPPDVLKKEIASYGFVEETQIGAENCNRCHPDIVEQWSKSAHRFSSFNNPFYEATVNLLREKGVAPNKWIDTHIEQFPEARDEVGKVKSKWCSACHDPALMLPGEMIAEIDRATTEAQAGLTCLACHAIDKIHNRTGNGNYNIADEQEDPYLFANAENGTLGAYLHDAALKAKPTVHKRQLLKPFFQASEFCATCHKVSLTEPVNNYRWLRGQNEFDNWHDSGISMNASRTFYLPPAKRVCQNCHMPLEPAPRGDVAAKNGFVRSHRFLAVNTALPYLRGDRETLDRIEAFLQNEKLRVDIFALKTEEMLRPIMAVDQANPHLPAGQKITVDVVVRNKGVGHTFPGGTNDSNEGWLEFSISDSADNTLSISGFLDENGHLDPMAHTFKAVILDKHGNPINKRNAQDIHVTVYANVIGPGTADIAHYEFTLPKALAGQSIQLRARLLWRKFDRKYTEFAFQANREGFAAFDKVPDLPVTEIAADSVVLKIADFGNGIAVSEIADLQAEQWVRFNDYGIGLLLEGDTRGATLAFEQVASLKPSKIEGPLNLAKTAIRDGNIDRAYQYLKQCEQIKPGDARVAWVWGVVLQEDGRYEQAVAAYKRVLEKFPEDRAAWRNLGRTYYLNRQFERALEAFEQVLEIDPEDRIAWYHIMLSHKALGNTKAAQSAEAAYAYYQIDESAQEITRAYKRKNPGDNLMAQQIRTHKLKIK